MTARFFDVPFATSGDLVAVPDAVQPDGSVSYTQGYGIDYSTPVGSGGLNIERAKMNQIFNDITTLLQQLQTNAFPLWYSSLAGAAGYPKFACVLYTDGNVYQSQVNANASTPGADANWVVFPLGNFTGFSTGDVKLTMKATADTGWVMCNNGTIGNGSSGGTTRANADTSALFTLLWTNVSNTYAPVSGGRGGSAAADFAANKTITLTQTLGRALGISGAGSGLTSRALGQTLGEETHTPILAELFAHTHTATVTDLGHTHTVLGVSGTADNTQQFLMGSGPTLVPANNKTGALVSATTGVSVANATQGSSTAFNVMQPTSFLNAMIKL